MGKPGSIGCIRMRNQDLQELFDTVAVGTSVEIRER
jgi:lipoprotein-anchoring transpeptidase ErfK/SrfK